jgi:hypothetical protein
MQGCPAECHLKADIAAKFHERMTPLELQKTRNNTLNFPWMSFELTFTKEFD